MAALIATASLAAFGTHQLLKGRALQLPATCASLIPFALWGGWMVKRAGLQETTKSESSKENPEKIDPATIDIKAMMKRSPSDESRELLSALNGDPVGRQRLIEYIGEDQFRGRRVLQEIEKPHDQLVRHWLDQEGSALMPHAFLGVVADPSDAMIDHWLGAKGPSSSVHFGYLNQIESAQMRHRFYRAYLTQLSDTADFGTEAGLIYRTAPSEFFDWAVADGDRRTQFFRSFTIAQELSSWENFSDDALETLVDHLPGWHADSETIQRKRAKVWGYAVAREIKSLDNALDSLGQAVDKWNLHNTIFDQLSKEFLFDAMLNYADRLDGGVVQVDSQGRPRAATILGKMCEWFVHFARDKAEYIKSKLDQLPTRLLLMVEEAAPSERADELHLRILQTLCRPSSEKPQEYAATKEIFDPIAAIDETAITSTEELDPQAWKIHVTGGDLSKAKPGTQPHMVLCFNRFFLKIREIARDPSYKALLKEHGEKIDLFWSQYTWLDVQGRFSPNPKKYSAEAERARWWENV